MRPRVVCLHGVTNHGRHFAKLAEALPGFHVLAPDLLGHGSSPYEPPWDLETHIRRGRRDRRGRARDSHRPLVRRPARVRARGASAEARAEARPARPRDPRPSARSRSSPPRTRARTAPTSPSRRGSTAATTRASSRERRASSSRRSCAATSSGTTRAATGTATANPQSSQRTERWPRSRRPSSRCAVPTLLVLGEQLVSPLRPPAGGAPGRARRSPRGRRRPRRAHRALGCARGDSRSGGALLAVTGLRR